MIQYKICKQKEGFCGPASLKIVFDYYGIEKSQEEWAKCSGATKKDGVQNDGLIKAIQSVGFSCKVLKESSSENIRKLLAKNQIIIAIWWSGNGGHYSPVVDINDKAIFLADPEIGKVRKMSLIDFDHFWFDFAKDNNRAPEDLELRTILWITLRKSVQRKLYQSRLIIK